MWLIAGLGNPGGEYAATRHNIGFMAIDALADGANFSNKFQSETATVTLGGEKCILLKPQTYMNNSGRAVQAAMAFYKITPENVVIIHDEFAIPLGEVKLKKTGNNAGHNGLKSIDILIGNIYPRIRIGIGPLPEFNDASNFVLGNFSKSEKKDVDAVIKCIKENIKIALQKFREENFTNMKFIVKSAASNSAVLVSAKNMKESK